MRAAERASTRDVTFPRAWLGDTYDFSFSGLKTAARRTVDGVLAERRNGNGHVDPGDLQPETAAELAWGFQESVVDVLATKTTRAAVATGARAIVLGGGVAANGVLRERIAGTAAERGIPLIVPRPALCTDNGAMIGAAAARRFRAGERARWDLDARPSLPLATR
jgi:N6-L-threonylcarbamoyladenine synthase